MDKYSFRENLIYIESECRYLPQHENLDLLNTLTRKLSAANAKIEKAPHGPFCSYKMQAHIAPCDCWKSED